MKPLFEDITFKINKDFRCFKQGQELKLQLMNFGVNYIVGPNGSGKSTLIHAIRAKKHSLADINRHDFDGMVPNDDKLFNTDELISVEGLDSYDEIFVLDSVDDDPLSFTNSATASGLVGGGGYSMLHLSKGQKAQAMQTKFLVKLQEVTGFTPADYRAGKTYDKNPLIIVDEIDEGLDIKNQVMFNKLLNNIASIYHATLICICHNFLCIGAGLGGMRYPVYDITQNKIVEIGEYIEAQTGLKLTIDKKQ